MLVLALIWMALNEWAVACAQLHWYPMIHRMHPPYGLLPGACYSLKGVVEMQKAHDVTG